MGVLRGIELACRKHGQDILLSPLSENDPRFDFLRPYRQRKADGMIYVGLRSLPAEIIHEIEARSIPCVVLGDRPEHKNISWIDTDNERAGYETTRRIQQLGHQNIAFFGLEDGLYNTNIEDREKGYLRAMQELTGAVIDRNLIVRGSWDQRNIRDGIRKLLETVSPRPTAILCSTDSRVLASLQAAGEAGLRVPDDLSIIGFDGFPRDSLLYPSIATNEQPLIEMGKRAVEILLEHIADKQLPRREVVLPLTFLDGKSLGPPPGDSRYHPG
jgi:LacI family transcriptional regulator